MIDIKEHVRQEFIQAFGEEKGLYWYESMVESKDEADRWRGHSSDLRDRIAHALRELDYDRPVREAESAGRLCVDREAIERGDGFFKAVIERAVDALVRLEGE